MLESINHAIITGIRGHLQIYYVTSILRMYLFYKSLWHSYFQSRLTIFELEASEESKWQCLCSAVQRFNPLRWEDNLKTDVTETSCDYSNRSFVTHKEFRRSSFVVAVMNFQIPLHLRADKRVWTHSLQWRSTDIVHKKPMSAVSWCLSYLMRNIVALVMQRPVFGWYVRTVNL
jgi:hypothetical protein